jgi:ribosome maturation factor RimP
MFAHEKIHGIDRTRLLAAVEPVLAAHHVDGVELIWRTDSKGWVLSITVEVPGRSRPGEGVTLDLCSEISRDVSAALDVAEVITNKYRLEVGSPGLERALYSLADYERFRGQRARIKLTEALDGQFVHRVTLAGLNADGNVVFETELGERAVDFERIDSAHLVLELGTSAQGGSVKGSRKARALGRGR